MVGGSAALVGASLASAHEVPAQTVVQALLKPEGQRLRLLVRVPLAAVRDVEYPKRGAGYLDLPRAGPALLDAAHLWIADAVELYEGDRRLGRPERVVARVSLPSDGSFAGYPEALAHVTGPPLAADTELLWNQSLLDVLLEYRIESERSRFAIHPAFGRLGLRVVTSLRFLHPDGFVRPFELTGDPGLVRLDPRWLQAALRFVGLGFRHILEGTDHLLFLLCLVIPLARFRDLVLVVTSFTLAHSVTLIASAMGVAPGALWFPPLVETLIAASIVYLALENILSTRLTRRWLITFAFGLVHGFGFSFGLREARQFAGSHLTTSLLSFNVGVELGQLLVLVVAAPVAAILLRRGSARRVGTIVASALLAHTAWHWMVERAQRLRQFPFQWPTVDAALLAGLLRWVMLLLVAAGLAWLVFGVLLPSRSPRPERER